MQALLAQLDRLPDRTDALNVEVGQCRTAEVIAVDTSAIVAIALGEPERQDFVGVIERAGNALISTVSVVEARMVVHGRRGQRAVVLLNDLLRLPVFELVAPDAPEAEVCLRRLRGLRDGKRSLGRSEFRRRVQLCTRKGARFAVVIQGC